MYITTRAAGSSRCRGRQLFAPGCDHRDRRPGRQLAGAAGAFLKRLDALRKSLNIGSFIGQGSVRETVMGRVNRPATAAEIDQMRMLVEQGMKDGAFGLSTGLAYVPGVYAPLAEIVELERDDFRFGSLSF
jgi:hypothetical protein